MPVPHVQSWGPRSFTHLSLSVLIMDVVTSVPVRSDVCFTASAPARIDEMVLASEDALERTPTSGLAGEGKGASTRPDVSADTEWRRNTAISSTSNEQPHPSAHRSKPESDDTVDERSEAASPALGNNCDGKGRQRHVKPPGKGHIKECGAPGTSGAHLRTSVRTYRM